MTVPFPEVYQTPRRMLQNHRRSQIFVFSEPAAPLAALWILPRPQE